MQEYKKKTKRVKLDRMSHIEHMQLMSAVNVLGAFKPVFVPYTKMWQLGKTNVVVFRLPRTKVLGFHSRVPNCSDKQHVAQLTPEGGSTYPRGRVS